MLFASSDVETVATVTTCACLIVAAICFMKVRLISTELRSTIVEMDRVKTNRNELHGIVTGKRTT